jgi:hypothetical protein
LGRLDKASGGTFKKALIHAGKETVEEAFQEALQQAGQNTIANYYVGYDPERDWKEGLEESVAGAGPSGFLMSVLGSLGSLVKSDARKGPCRRRTVSARVSPQRMPGRVTPVQRTSRANSWAVWLRRRAPDRAGTYLTVRV